MSIMLQTLMILANETAIQSVPKEMNSYNNYLLEVGVEMKKEKCYGSYGCYNLNPPWTSDHRPVSLFPENLEKVQPTYPFYSRSNPHTPIYLDLNEPELVSTVGLNPNLPLYLLSHGFTEDGDKFWLKKLKDELLKRDDCNVIIINWGKASSPPYPQAVANIRLVGTISAHLVETISPFKRNGVLEKVHCIGHSLGGHACGYIGYTLQQRFNLTLARITGMDPAEPHFAKNEPPVRLDRSAAKYVDVIHTDANGFTSAGFGIVERIGHVDFYPNGGFKQPGCVQSVFEYISLEKSFVNGVKKFLACSHVRAYEFFIESINTKVPAMGITCPTYEDFVAGKCFSCRKEGTYCMRFGYNSYQDYKYLVAKRKLHPQRNLILYLLTSDASPFCKSHYKITVTISSEHESKVHRGEVGSLWVTIHSTSDGRGPKSNRIQLNNRGYHEPGAVFSNIVAGDLTSKMKAAEVEFQYDSNVMNPLTWRILSAPKLYVSKVQIESLETEKQITVCPKDGKPLISSLPQIMLPTYCL